MSSTTTTAAPAEARTVSLYTARRKIYSRAVQGRFARWRWAFVWLTQAVFYGLPWLQWGERPALLFDLAARRFYIFGLVFYPQDLIYLTALLLVSAYSLFLFTAVAGRLWCGYACPQTVYTQIFMWVERRLEGDRAARIRLDAAPWTAAKIARKAGKQAVWIAIALATGFTFVGYFTPIRDLAAAVPALALGPWQTFWVLFYGFATYGNAGFMREQICKYVCPYARFQSAMFDKDTLIIGYDAQRGEPRAPIAARAAAAAPRGACVDCGLCVQVCPTGIDIRKGLQYECIGCAACIDACDSVMTRLKQPAGLVRYDTQNGFEGNLPPARRWRGVLRPRVVVYTAVLLAIGTAVATGIALRPPFKLDVVRDRASLARVVDDGWVENVYRLQLMNATESPQRYALRADGLGGLAMASPAQVELGPAEARWLTAVLRVPPQTAAATAPGAHAIRFTVDRVASGGEPERTVLEPSTFLIPR